MLPLLLRSMNYLQVMGTKNISVVVAIVLTGFILGCDPPREFCDDMATFARVPDLIILEPLQDTYNKGDVITLKTSIANISPYFAEPNVNLLEVTGLQNALLVSNNRLYEGNGLEFLTGSQGRISNWFNMPYNPETDRYEFELKMTLNRVGNYNFITAEFIDIIGEDCNRYRIETNIAGANADSRIEFEVLE